MNNIIKERETKHNGCSGRGWGLYSTSFFFNDFYFFHHIWFTVFCQFSTVQQGDPVTHAYIHSFSHIIMLHHK